MSCFVAIVSGCGGDVCSGPKPQCPAGLATLTITSPAGGALSGVVATVSGQPLSCDSTPTGALCLGGGDGALHVEAPGYQPVDVDSTVTTAHSTCGCPATSRPPVKLVSISSTRTSIELATGSPVGIAVDANSVYWTNTGGGPAGDIAAVMKAPLNGGTPVTLASSAGSSNLAIDATNAYWTSGVEVMTVPLEGGTPITLASGNVPLGIAVDASNVYWIDAGDFKVMKVSRRGAGDAVTTLAADLEFHHSIAVDATSVYWANSGYAPMTGSIMKVALDGGTPVTLASGLDAPSHVALDAANVYWTNLSGTVMKVPLAGGTATTLAASQNQPSGLAVDATRVYWVTGDGSVNAVPITGGSIITLATSPDGISGREIAVDDTSIYWTQDNQQFVSTGSVMKLSPK